MESLWYGKYNFVTEPRHNLRPSMLQFSTWEHAGQLYLPRWCILTGSSISSRSTRNNIWGYKAIKHLAEMDLSWGQPGQHYLSGFIGWTPYMYKSCAGSNFVDRIVRGVYFWNINFVNSFGQLSPLWSHVSNALQRIWCKTPPEHMNSSIIFPFSFVLDCYLLFRQLNFKERHVSNTFITLRRWQY